MLSRLLLLLTCRYRVWSMIVNKAFRDVIIAIMWIRDFVRRLGHTQSRDLMEVDLAIEYIDKERIETTPWRNVSIGSRYNRPTFAHVSGTSDTLVPPIHCMSTRRWSFCVVIAIIRLLLFFVSMHRMQVIANDSLMQGEESFVFSVNEGDQLSGNSKGCTLVTVNW